MDIRTQSALLASIVGLALGLSMLLRAGRPRVHTLYSVFALFVGGFYLAQFVTGVFAGTQNHPWVIRGVLGTSILLGALIPSSPPSSPECRIAVEGWVAAGVGVEVRFVAVTCAGRGR